ncbi:Phosphotyrosine protein phosphatases superfamily protein [Arabidopsis thaliana]|uniref:Isoform 2 of Phosphatidylglycerophosphate phosphatase PTPMT2 n=1 Tax=Arabidopsis thaliana TaxID=3702 RepID=Q6NKR2-2|nr:Phosphotyrosine protein phosphatases superfamily protein [Arabidopsis thaliana]AED96788.1 Phosphotyrosine protein phosphatases superfamily protein [Arabidopsis thaliana]|eukprot:NP_001032084.1 Phosphotyrosine protein phosphatases superfamily protein [Arabidopsis thaliana]
MTDETEEDDTTQQRSSRNDGVSKNKGKGFKGDKAKRALIGAGGRILFYPTLLYNLVRFKLQSQFRWWDQIDEAYEMEHLVIPTRDYLFAPSIVDITLAVNFIHKNALLGKTTYVHCKAGRGRSTTVVLCYLIEHKSMTVAAAFEHVRSIRPRVLLHPSQRKVVEEFSRLQSPLSESTFIATSGDIVS